MRTIKPTYLTNELLAECDPLARILFAGLWMHADREGRLEDRPRKIKVDCLPYDDCDIQCLLEQLHVRGFIVRYAVDGRRLIQVVTFHRHQNPHYKEPESVLPPPDCVLINEQPSGDAQPMVEQPSPDEEPIIPGIDPSTARPAMSHESWGAGHGVRGVGRGGSRDVPSPDPGGADAPRHPPGKRNGARPKRSARDAVRPGQPGGWSQTYRPGEQIEAPSAHELAGPAERAARS